MARARNIKPSFFTNEIIGTLDPIIGMAFIGLWCLADKDGRLEDRPLRIKAELFPYREGTDVNGYLTVMEREGFIDRYEVDGVKYIQVVNFEKHQSPHHTEKSKGYPPKPSASKASKNLTVIKPIDNQDHQVQTRSDSLIPDSLIPDSGSTDSLIDDSTTLPAASQPTQKKKNQDEKTPLQLACRETWLSYGKAYFERYGTEPVGNRTVYGQVKAFVERIGHEESPLVAAFFVTHQESFYVKKCHAFGLALHDAEKLRTEWATRRMVTNTSAQQADRTGNMMSIVDEILAERGAA